MAHKQQMEKALESDDKPSVAAGQQRTSSPTTATTTSSGTEDSAWGIPQEPEEECAQRMSDGLDEAYDRYCQETLALQDSSE